MVCRWESERRKLVVLTSGINKQPALHARRRTLVKQGVELVTLSANTYEMLKKMTYYVCLGTWSFTNRH